MTDRDKTILLIIAIAITVAIMQIVVDNYKGA